MSCPHGDNEKYCEICAEIDAAYNHGYIAGELSACDHCMCAACQQGLRHDSDCAVHNMPAMPVEPCNCTKRPSIDAAIGADGSTDSGTDRKLLEMAIGECPKFPSVT